MSETTRPGGWRGAMSAGVEAAASSAGAPRKDPNTCTGARAHVGARDYTPLLGEVLADPHLDSVFQGLPGDVRALLRKRIGEIELLRAEGQAGQAFLRAAALAAAQMKKVHDANPELAATLRRDTTGQLLALAVECAGLRPGAYPAKIAKEG